MNSTFCPWCGASMSPSHKFCRSCGREILDGPEPSSGSNFGYTRPESSVPDTSSPHVRADANRTADSLESSQLPLRVFQTGAIGTHVPEMATPLSPPPAPALPIETEAPSQKRRVTLVPIVIAAIVVIALVSIALIGGFRGAQSTNGSGGAGSPASVTVSDLTVVPSIGNVIMTTYTTPPVPTPLVTHAGGSFQIGFEIQTINLAPVTGPSALSINGTSPIFIAIEPTPNLTFTTGGGVITYTWTDTLTFAVDSSATSGTYALTLTLQLT